MKRVLPVGLVLVILGGAALAAQPSRVSVRTTPPVVVKTVPQAGDTQVDPNLKEIQVTFSKPMADKSWSWSSVAEDTNPETTGEPRYLEDHRTCVLPVKLEPGHTYGFWINSQKFQGFRGADKQAAIPYLLIFETKK
jgi:RNA polymerase sigma-70 factor (ECF subfamily)